MNTVKIDISAFHAAFFDEAEEHVGTMESTLLALESRPGDPELLGRIFRAAHSIKGASGTFGFAGVMHFTHGLEALLDAVRSGTVQLTPPTSGLLLRAVDLLRALLASTRSGDAPPDGLEVVEAELLAASGARGGGATAPASAPVPSSAAAPARVVTFVPNADLFATGMDPLLVVRDLCELGEVLDIEVDAERVPALEVMDPETSYFGWKVTIVTPADEAAIRDVFAFVEDSSVVAVESVPASETPPPPGGAPDERTAAPATGALRTAIAAGGTVRVATEKLDGLIDLVGELVICQSMVASAANDASPEGGRRLREAIAAMDRNTRELQDRVMAVRMVPIGTVFDRFPRVVRDIAAMTEKKIKLVVTGEETELDKGMVELLADPLTHLVRNAADHGIEAPAERVAAGKPEEGLVTLRAMHEGGNVVVEVSDDGRGMQTARIREKAIARGLISATDDPSDDELHALVFAPGFSTAAAVTDVSGRGVGMDVVKRNVEGMGGAITFHTAQGRGSTMRIRLPLTMAIMEGLSVRVGEQVFIVPLLAILESFRPTNDQVSTVFGRGEVVRVRGEPIRLVRLHEQLGVEAAETDPRRALVCVIEAGRTRAALLVDEVLGQAQVVVKSLEAHYRKVDGITGATILGDGRVALILDVQAIVQRAATA